MPEDKFCAGRVGPDPEIRRLQEQIEWLKEHSPRQWRSCLFRVLELANNIRHTSRVGGVSSQLGGRNRK